MARLRLAARSMRWWLMSSSRAAACLSNSSCIWPCVAGRSPGDATRSTPSAGAPLHSGCHAELRSPGTPLARTLPGRHTGGAVSRFRGGPQQSGPTLPGTAAGAPTRAPGRHAARGGVRTRCRRPQRAWRVGVLLGGVQPGGQGGLVSSGADRRPLAALDRRGIRVALEEVALCVGVGAGQCRLPRRVEEAQ